MASERRQGKGWRMKGNEVKAQEGLVGRSRSAGGWREGERISSKFHFS